MGYEILHEDLDTAWRKVAAMKYIPEEGNYCKSPKEFFLDGGGDCEDFAATLVYYLGPESSAIRIEWPVQPHYIVFCHGLYIEPQTEGRYYNESRIIILDRYDYDFILEWATRKGNKSL
jgi:hypothetical protein